MVRLARWEKLAQPVQLDLQEQLVRPVMRDQRVQQAQLVQPARSAQRVKPARREIPAQLDRRARL